MNSMDRKSRFFVFVDGSFFFSGWLSFACLEIREKFLRVVRLQRATKTPQGSALNYVSNSKEKEKIIYFELRPDLVRRDYDLNFNPCENCPCRDLNCDRKLSRSNFEVRP